MIKQYMSAMGVEEAHYQNGDFEVTTPIDGSVIGKVTLDTVADVDTKSKMPNKPSKNGVSFLPLNVVS